MIKNTECLVDENGFEIMATYEYNLCHSDDHFDSLYDTYLQSVELIIEGKGIEILLLLNEKQKQSIIDKLTYE